MPENSGTYLTRAWGLLIGAIAGLIVLAFYLLGHFEIGKFAGFSAGAIMAAARIEWDYRNKYWFWVILLLVSLLHVGVLSIIELSSESHPALIFAPIFIVDIFIIVFVIEQFCRLIDGNG